MHAHFDFETYSMCDLRKTGADAYSEHESTGVWCMGFAIGDGPVQLWTPKDPDPDELLDHVSSGGKVAAWNVTFDALIWNNVVRRGRRAHWPRLQPTQLDDIMARAYALALPGSLEDCGKALELGIEKDMVGHRLMMRMAKPRRMADDGTPVWWDEADRTEKLHAYCMQDVEVERLLAKRLRPLQPSEQKLWQLDYEINRRGVAVDTDTVRLADELIRSETERLNQELSELTGGEVRTATNAAAIVRWMADRGLPVADLRKTSVVEYLASDDVQNDTTLRRVLQIRQEASQTATRKLKAMLDSVSADGRARGLLGYHVATTGRWAGRRIQPQNMKRSTLTPDELRWTVQILKRPGAGDTLRRIFDKPTDHISECVRGMLVPAKGLHFVGGDFSNIEGRVLAWLAGEDWKLDAFRAYDNGTGPDLYKLAYSRSFNVPVQDVTKDQRQIGKVQELALGYQGGVGAFRSMAANYGITVLAPGEPEPAHMSDSVITEEQADVIKDAWRDAHPRTVIFWRDLQQQAISAVQNPGRMFTTNNGKIRYATKGDWLFCALPSTRLLAYYKPRIEHVTFERTGRTYPQLRYMGIHTTTRKWIRLPSYGGHLAENVTQAVARDILAAAIIRAEDAGFETVLHVHDEILTERLPFSTSEAERLRGIMCELPDWAGGLPIAAETWQGERYEK